jgi:membrane protein DedA with SNARE-associated domain
MADNTWIDSLSQWLVANPTWAGLIIFIVAFTESIVVVGILIPGIMILFALGALIGLGLVDFYMAWATASVGAILGDSFSYWVGRRYRDSLASRWPFNRWPELFEQGRTLFRKRGILGVVIGRFVGPLRPIVPVVAGMLAMKPRQFYPTAIVAGIAWSPAYLIPGVVLGASLDVASAYTLRLSVLLGIVVVSCWLVYLMVRGIYRTLSRRTPWLLKRAVATLRRHPRLEHYIGPLVIPARGDLLSIAMLGLVLAVTLSIFTTTLLYAVIPGTPDLDQLSARWALALRSHVADWPLLLMLQISKPYVLSTVLLSVSGWLAFKQRRSTLVHWLVAALGAPLLALLMQSLLKLLPQWPEYLAEWGQFPDLAATYTSAVLGFFPILMARDLRASRRKWLYLSAALFILLAFIARAYFQLASFSGLVAAILLSTVWCTIVGIGLRVRASAWHPARPLLLTFYMSFALALIGSTVLRGPYQLMVLAPKVNIEHISMVQWQQQYWQQLPQQRSWIGQASEPFNLQWLGSISAIRQSLNEAGWQWQAGPPKPSDIIRILHPDPKPSELPLFLEDHGGRAAQGLAVKVLRYQDPEQGQQALDSLENNKQRQPERIMVLRFWDSGLRVQQENSDSPATLWLVEAVEEAVEIHGWWFSSWTPQTQSKPLSFETLGLNAQQWQQQQTTDQRLLLAPNKR